MAKLELIFLGIFLGILDVLYPSPAEDHAADGPVVDTMYGPVRGVYVQQGAMFLGVPFAAPPVGSLRWQPPQPPAKWSGTYNATAPSAACMQHECGPDDADSIGQCPPSRKRSEDCLYLNVFMPVNTDKSKLPVIFWIHGGNFWGGSAMGPLYDGRFLANKTRTVVVAANYRLSALGFLVAGQGEGAATGNYGILDQIAALQWVQDNIAEFGGDKDRVTIYGQSAGAYSVVLHMTVNKSDHLFHGAIAASPPLSLTFKGRVEALIYGDEFSQQLNCAVGNMQCLRAASASQVLDAQYAVRLKIVNPFDLIELFEPWGPTVDGDLVAGQVVDAFENGKFKRNERPIDSVLVTHYLFPCPARYVIRNAAKQNDTNLWLYVFAHPLSFKHAWGNLTHCEGHVCHGTDVVFVFQSQTLRGYHFTADEQVLADSMAYYYGNFAHTGDPNKPGSRLTHTGDPNKPGSRLTHTGDPNKPGSRLTKQPNGDSPPEWPPYLSSENYTNLRFNTPNSLEQGYLKEKCDFWDSISPYP
ncbi:cAMP-regulated D2 protein-like [Branchiostoma floridae]|uniref:Carboxylic ester hydrolase n=1 Tax=Branchiostoma floridae TaxID=7739 RepID=A0A9J7MYE7_BRAFL|nr:cAMP-regulated D2 protein-like [Branchiostoma floridae]